MKITEVEAMALDTGKDYPDPKVAAEAHGVRFLSLLKITTDEGIVGWSDIETQPHVGKAIVDAPSGGQIGFESLRNALVGEDPLERERLWEIAGKALGQPVCMLLGAKYRDRVKAYASTLFRPPPEDMKRAVAEYLKLGFRAIKFGCGVFGRDLELDIALVRAAREEAGS